MSSKEKRITQKRCIISGKDYRSVLTEQSSHEVTRNVRYVTKSETSLITRYSSTDPRSLLASTSLNKDLSQFRNSNMPSQPPSSLSQSIFTNSSTIPVVPSSSFSITRPSTSLLPLNNNFQTTDAIPYRSHISTYNTPNKPSSPLYKSALDPSRTFGSYKSGSSISPLNRQFPAPVRNPPPLLTLKQQSPRPAHSTEESNSIPTYPIKGMKIKGKALIINNIKFMEKDHERQGAEKDGHDLEKILKNIGFSCTSCKNLTAHDMRKKIRNFSGTAFSNYDVSVVVMMSHGTNVSSDEGKAIRGGYTEIVGIDGYRLAIDEVVESFSQNTKGLEGKPKIFIFQCCRGDSDQIHVDAVPIQQKNKQSDVLIAFSTLPGFVSNRDPSKGSWYIQSICEVFSEHYKNHHVEDMLKLVAVSLSKKNDKYAQTSTYESRGFKRCYLHPQSSKNESTH